MSKDQDIKRYLENRQKEIDGAALYRALGGSLIGALVMISLTSGMNLMGMDISYQYIVRATVLAAAVIFDVVTRNRGQQIFCTCYSRNWGCPVRTAPVLL